MDRQCPPAPPPYLTASPPPSSNPSLFLCRMKKEEDSLTIFGVAERDQGSYTCVASTELDQDLAKAYLTVLGNHRCPRPAAAPAPLPRVQRGGGGSEGSARSQPASQAWGSSCLRA